MAAAPLPAPGTEYGPCEPSCAHTDCAETRRMAALPCKHCGDPIGYDRPLFNVTPDDAPVWTVLAHATCEYDAIDRETAR